jgi:hypothetical protein
MHGLCDLIDAGLLALVIDRPTRRTAAETVRRRAGE